MSQLYKYWFAGLLAGNICQQYSLLHPCADLLFYSSLVVCLIYVLSNFSKITNQGIIKEYSIIYIFIFIMIGYQLLIGWMFIFPKTITYIISKTIICLGVILVIDDYKDIYCERFLQIVAFITAVFLIIGYLTNNVTISGRQTLGFGNPNSTGAIASICFGISFIVGYKKKIIRFAVPLVCLLGVLLSGSRSAMGIILVAVLIKYGISKKLILYGILSLFVVFVILPDLGLSFAGIDRFTNAIESNDFASGRATEREATIFMIKDSPIIGNGIYCGQSEEAKNISVLGSHNAYLDFLKWYGIPLGMILICSLIFFAIKSYIKYRDTTDMVTRTYLFILIAVMLAANYEAYIWGVNQMITTLFFLALAYILNTDNNIENEHYDEAV